jgi:undecaprenyl-diphosphatase
MAHFSIIDLIKYIILGLVQGITEMLPISSSGHVAIAEQLLGIRSEEEIFFLVLINLGSFVALMIHFRKMILRLIRNFLLYIFKRETREETKTDFHYCLKIVLASIPIGITGYFLADSLNSLLYNYPLVIVGVGLLATGTLLYTVRNASYSNGRQEITYQDAAIIGLGQMFAPIPGLSRNGVTISSGLYRKLSMETMLNFSFMLYIPVSLGSILKSFLELVSDPAGFNPGFDTQNTWYFLYYFVAMAVSFMATMYALKYVYGLFRRGKLILFSIYTLILGMVVFIAGIALL